MRSAGGQEASCRRSTRDQQAADGVRQRASRPPGLLGLTVLRGGSQDCPSPEQRTQWWQWGKRRVTALKGLSVSLTSGPDGLWARAQGKPKTRIPSPRVIFKKVEEGQRPPKVFQLRKMRGCSFALGTHRPRSTWSPGLSRRFPCTGHQGAAEGQQRPWFWRPKAGCQSR